MHFTFEMCSFKLVAFTPDEPFQSKVDKAVRDHSFRLVSDRLIWCEVRDCIHINANETEPRAQTHLVRTKCCRNESTLMFLETMRNPCLFPDCNSHVTINLQHILPSWWVMLLLHHDLLLEVSNHYPWLPAVIYQEYSHMKLKTPHFHIKYNNIFVVSLRISAQIVNYNGHL